MEIQNGNKAMICQGLETESPVGEQRMWTAVLVQALEDWKGVNLRARRAAEQFLLRDTEDFEIVCSGAGINANSFRAKLSRFRPLTHEAEGWRVGLAA